MAYEIKGDVTVGRNISIGGKASIGSGTPDANAILHLLSTTQAFIPPRMTTTQKLAISPATEGMVVFDTTLKKFSYYNNTTWVNLDASSGGITAADAIKYALVLG